MTTVETPYLNPPSEAERAAAAVAADKIQSFAGDSASAYAHLFAGDYGETEVVAIPRLALGLLADVLDVMAAGNAVMIVPVHTELSTQEGANILNVSRPHLVKLLEQGALPHTKTGRKRRIKLADLMAFKATREATSRTAMGELADQAQDLKLGY